MPTQVQFSRKAFDLKRLADEHEAADYLHLKVATLRRWRWAGRGPVFVRVGGRVRYDLADLDVFIAAGRRSSTTASEPPVESET